MLIYIIQAGRQVHLLGIVWWTCAFYRSLSAKKEDLRIGVWATGRLERERKWSSHIIDKQFLSRLAVEN